VVLIINYDIIKKLKFSQHLSHYMLHRSILTLKLVKIFMI